MFMFFMTATSFFCYLLDVNPYDQPGVELGKVITFDLMGRKATRARQNCCRSGQAHNRDLNLAKVKLLSKDVIGLIAAGEVIERPCVRGKRACRKFHRCRSNVHIKSILRAGIELIRIADNGSGMDETTLKQRC